MASCSTEIQYGGGTCDPDANAAAVFEAINAMRIQNNQWSKYLTEGDSKSLISCSSNYLCKSDFDGDGVSENRTFIRSKINIANAASSISSAGNLDPLEWTPGLFFTA